MRADARRNREKVLRAAFEALATEGLAVPVQEIARRAGVGTGTVSRHFPTKEALYAAVVAERLERMVRAARALAEEKGPGEAFRDFFVFMVDEGALNHGVGEALRGNGFDIAALVRETGHDVTAALDRLLRAAQLSGEVRADVTAEDVKALVDGCMARERRGPDEEGRRRTVAVVLDGLAPRDQTAHSGR